MPVASRQRTELMLSSRKRFAGPQGPRPASLPAPFASGAVSEAAPGVSPDAAVRHFGLGSVLRLDPALMRDETSGRGGREAAKAAPSRAFQSIIRGFARVAAGVLAARDRTRSNSR